MTQDEDRDLEAKGLVSHNYTNLFAIRPVLHKVGDIPVPFRQGMRADQFAAFLVVLVGMFIFFGLIFVPFKVLTGFSPAWDFYLWFFLVPPVIAAFRIGKPLPSGKSLPGAISSYVRAKLDDPVHRRGVPIPEPKPDGPQVRYQREWVSPEVLLEEEVEKEFRQFAGDTDQMAPVVSLEHWLDQRSEVVSNKEKTPDKLEERLNRINSRLHAVNGTAPGMKNGE